MHAAHIKSSVNKML